jgi:hypothetical protein
VSDATDRAAAPAPVEGARGRIPDFFVVGHPKCGTTALHRMLRRHPQICIPLKGPRFLSPELLPLFTSGKQPETLEQYLSIFSKARSGQRIGVVTPVYLLSHVAAGNIAELQPAARIIAILREPASFLRSFHLQCVQGRVETETDLRKAIALEGARREQKAIPRSSARPQELLYTEYVRYVEQLRRYHAVFPREQVLVLIYDDYRRDNEGTLRRVLEFLGVDDMAPIEVLDANPTVGVRFRRLHAALHSVRSGQSPPSRAVKASVKALTTAELRTSALKAMRQRLIYGEPPPPDDSLMLELRRRFKPEVVAVSEYLGRDLVSLWGYDGIEP